MPVPAFSLEVAMQWMTNHLYTHSYDRCVLVQHVNPHLFSAYTYPAWQAEQENGLTGQMRVIMTVDLQTLNMLFPKKPATPQQELPLEQQA